MLTRFQVAQPFLWLLLLHFSSGSAHAQQSIAFPKQDLIPSLLLKIAPHKTTSLIFPFPIQGADLGSADLIMQKATGTRNVLWVKAAISPFPPTSLCVITADGKLYSFLVQQDPNPPSISFRLSDSVQPTSMELMGSGPGNPSIEDSVAWGRVISREMDQAQILSSIQRVKRAKKKLRGCRTRQEGIGLQLTGVFIQGEVLFFRLLGENKTSLPYQVEHLGFSVRGKMGTRRTATQEVVLHPLPLPDDHLILAPHQVQTWVVVLPQMTLERGKFLDIEMLEKRGSRNLDLKVNPHAILGASLLHP
ncbi:MAG: conjugative transposon protein TraN [Chitinophagaceae bacterium]